MINVRRLVTIAILGLLLTILFSSPIVIHPTAYSESMSSNVGQGKQQQQQPFSLTIQEGFIANAGPQAWSMTGGDLVVASLTARPALASTTWSSVKYSLFATVSGLSANGFFSLDLIGTSSSSSQNVHVWIEAQVVNAVPAICFPSYSAGKCAKGDTSEIPAYFTAVGEVNSQVGKNAPVSHEIHLHIEDAAMNPFGGPIVISSFSGKLLVVATYSSAHTEWGGVVTEGSLSGSLGGGAPASTSVSGAFVQKIFASENYVTGNETDHGSVALVNMTNTLLDSQGTFRGNSSIPTTGEIDCSPTQLPGTCTETGFVSTGTFSMMSKQGQPVMGGYDVVWPAPSVVFGGVISGTVGSDGNTASSGNGSH